MTKLQISCIFTAQEELAAIIRQSFLFFLQKELDIMDSPPIAGVLNERGQEGNKEA